MEHNAEPKGLCLKDQPQIHLFFHSLQMPIIVYINFSPFFEKTNKQIYLYKFQYFLGKEQVRISGLSLRSCSFWFALWSSSQSTAEVSCNSCCCTCSLQFLASFLEWINNCRSYWLQFQHICNSGIRYFTCPVNRSFWNIPYQIKLLLLLRHSSSYMSFSAFT